MVAAFRAGSSESLVTELKPLRAPATATNIAKAMLAKINLRNE